MWKTHRNLRHLKTGFVLNDLKSIEENTAPNTEIILSQAALGVDIINTAKMADSRISFSGAICYTSE